MKHRYVYICAATIAGLVFAASTAQATLLMYDGFDYTAGANVTGQTGGTGTWTPGNAWRTGPSALTAVASSPGLSYGTLNVTGNLLDESNASATSTINFRDTGLFNSGDVWVSFLARAGDSTAITQFFGLSFYRTNDTTPIFNTQKIASNAPTVETRDTWGLVGSGAGGTTASTLIVVNPTDTYLLVTHLNIASNTAELFVNPPLAATPPGTANATVTGPTGGLSFDRIRVASAQSLNWQFDEIRIGQSFADVVPFTAIPEPSAIAFGCVSLIIGTMVCSSRRRRSR